jgi:tagaturonate reductase
MKPLVRNAINDNREYPLRILQFGGGNFLRAFTGWMVEVLNEETAFNGDIAIIKPTPRGSYRQLRQQQGLYYVVLRGIKGGQAVSETKRIHCVREIVNPYTQWKEYLQLAELQSIRFIFSNTTEAGIQFDSKAEKSENPPAGFPAKLTLWLYHRYQYFKGDKERGCIILPCELIEENGRKLYECIHRHALAWKLEAGFMDWLITANFFCNTLVDRIVSGFPGELSSSLHEQLGFRDELLVSGEYYHSWLIEGPEFIKNELPFEQSGLNVRFVGNLEAYREMKVRILNGSHTLMVAVGYLMGFRFVHECMRDEAMFNFLETMLGEEICPTLEMPAGEVSAFMEDTISRFRNPYLNHQLMSIALNSMAKLNTRVLPVLLDYFRRHGDLPPRIVLSIAALFCFYRGNVGGMEIELNDSAETILFFKEIWKRYHSSPEGARILVSEILSNPSLWAVDLAGIPGLSGQLAGCVYRIESKGMAGALTTII